MDNETRYKIALLHVIKFIDGDGFIDSFKPLSAKFANKISQMCKNIISGDEVEEAIRKANN